MIVRYDNNQWFGQFWQEQAMILERSWQLKSLPSLRLYSSRNYWNFQASLSDIISPWSMRVFLASRTDHLQFFSPSERGEVRLWMASKASMSSSSMFCSLGLLRRREMIVAKGMVPSLLGSSMAFISLISFSVGQWPRPRTKVGKWAVGMQPVSSLSKMENISWQQMSSSLERLQSVRVSI